MTYQTAEQGIPADFVVASLLNEHLGSCVSPLIVLWEQLGKLEYSIAATGFLCDVFNRLALSDIPSTPPVALAQTSPDHREVEKLTQQLHAGYREVAMKIIGDSDGDKVREWIELAKQPTTELHARCQELAERHCGEAQHNPEWN